MSPTSEEAVVAERMLSLAAEAEPYLTGPDSVAWMDRLEREHDSLRAGFSWFLANGKGAEALRMAADLWVFQAGRGHAEEARSWLADALAAPGAEARSPVRARALYGAGILAFRNLEEAAAERSFDECLTIARERDDPSLIVQATTVHARVALRRSDVPSVRKWSEEALAVARTRGTKADAARPLHMLAAAARIEGDLERAARFYRENLALNRELGRMDWVTTELGNLGALSVLAGNVAEAEPLLRECLELAYKRKDMYLAPYQLVWLGRVALARGDPARAATLFAAARSVFDATGLAMDPDEAPEYEKGLAAIRKAMDDASFEAAWAEGKRMSFDDAVALALSIQ